MAFWQDLYNLWNFRLQPGPLERAREQEVEGGGRTSPAEAGIRDGMHSRDGLRDVGEGIDINSAVTRINKLKEFNKLLKIPEVNHAMRAIANDACIAGDSPVQTAFDGQKAIRWLKERWDKNPEPFLVYCYDFEANDYTLGWAHHPRFVKRAKTVKLIYDDGSFLIATEDHLVLMRDESWRQAGDMRVGDLVMPFYRMEPNTAKDAQPRGQYPRVRSFKEGWMTERHFLDEWRTGGKAEVFRKEDVRRAIKLMADGHGIKRVAKTIGHPDTEIRNWLRKYGIPPAELVWLGGLEDARKVIAVIPHGETDVYDLSVDKHENFCVGGHVVHNCQIGENKHVLEVRCKNEAVKAEVQDLFFSRKKMDLDTNARKMVKRMCVNGDGFYELITAASNPEAGVLKVNYLPPATMFRLETDKGRLLEFQQSELGPDRVAAMQGTTHMPGTEGRFQVRRFTPPQIAHFRVYDDDLDNYPYGTSLLEVARGPAYLLKLMEDAMLTYRIARAPERRVYYVDVGDLPAIKVGPFMDRFKDMFRKKKVPTRAAVGFGPETVDERMHLPAPDEDIWIPTRQGSPTKIDTLPGGSNLGEIDDVLMFRKKLLIALGLPEAFFGGSMAGETRISISAMDVNTARMIESIQVHFANGLYHIAETHLRLRGFPPEAYEDLLLVMTPPSDYRKMARLEILGQVVGLATQAKAAKLFSDFDIFTRFFEMSEQEAREVESRNTLQQYNDLKMQIYAANPSQLGAGLPGDGGNEMPAEAGMQPPMMLPDGQDGPAQGPPGLPAPEQEADARKSGPQYAAAPPLPDPSPEDVRRYDLEIRDFDANVDAEDSDFGLT